MNKFSFLALFLLIAVAIADDDGQYRPGAYGDDGRYVANDEGRYSQDGSSAFSGSQAGRLVSPKFNNQFINRFNADTAASNISPFSFQPSFQKAVIVEPIRSQPSASYYKPQNSEASSRVLKLENDVNQDSYHYAYETENNIRGEENGRVINQNTKNEGIAATGFYEYVGPDNVKYRIEYIADENGFQAVGNHLPTPPPIPEEIARVLANIRN